MSRLNAMLVLGVLACVAACDSKKSGHGSDDGGGDDTPVVIKGEGGAPPTSSGGSSNSSGGTASSDCFENPTTHFEIINACTSATKIKKTPDLLLLNEDGSLPPLP